MIRPVRISRVRSARHTRLRSLKRYGPDRSISNSSSDRSTRKRWNNCFNSIVGRDLRRMHNQNRTPGELSQHTMPQTTTTTTRTATRQSRTVINKSIKRTPQCNCNNNSDNRNDTLFSCSHHKFESCAHHIEPCLLILSRSKSRSVPCIIVRPVYRTVTR